VLLVGQLLGEEIADETVEKERTPLASLMLPRAMIVGTSRRTRLAESENAARRDQRQKRRLSRMAALRGEFKRSFET
jgi:hypothetical protein